MTGIWNNFVKLATPIVALALLAFEGRREGVRVAAAVAGLAGLVGTIVLFALILRSESRGQGGHRDRPMDIGEMLASSGGHRRWAGTVLWSGSAAWSSVWYGIAGCR